VEKAFDRVVTFFSHESYSFILTKPQTGHIQEITLVGEIHNQKMERMNVNTIGDREKVMRGARTVTSPSIKGFQIHYNYIRANLAREGEKTPAEMAGIKIAGKTSG
jgi:hypothetical protein